MAGEPGRRGPGPLQDVSAVLERLCARGIQWLPALELTTHYVFERDGFVSLVERTAAGLGGIGAPGLLTERGVAMLVWRGEQAFFVVKDWEQEAVPAQVEALRRFAADLEEALREA